MEENLDLHRGHILHDRQGTHCHKGTRSRTQTLQKSNVIEGGCASEEFMLHLQMRVLATSRSPQALLSMRLPVSRKARTR